MKLKCSYLRIFCEISWFSQIELDMGTESMSEIKDTALKYEEDYDPKNIDQALDIAEGLKDHSNLSEEEFELAVSKMIHMLPSDLFGHLWKAQWDIRQEYGDVDLERFGILFRSMLGKAFGNDSRYGTMLDVITEAAVAGKRRAAEKTLTQNIPG